MITHIRRVSLLFVLAGLSFFTWAQDEDIASRKFFFGGNFNFMLGTVTSINVSPLVGYRITPKFSVGTGISYEYYREKVSSTRIFQTSMYGGRGFISYDLLSDIQKATGIPINGCLMAYSELEILNWKYFDSPSRFWIQSVYAGPGWRIPAGESSAIQLLLLWNLNQTIDSPYANPLFRFGFIF